MARQVKQVKSTEEFLNEFARLVQEAAFRGQTQTRNVTVDEEGKTRRFSLTPSFGGTKAQIKEI